jgi:hypothetical protein
MTSQRLTIAKLGGRSAQDVAALFHAWQKYTAEDGSPSEFAVAIDAFATRLREHAHCPPVLYFAEWIDLWSMGDLVPGLGDERAVIVASSRFEVACHNSPIRIQATTIAGEETQETRWLRNRIQEAQDAWSEVTQESVIIVIREVLGALVTDEELMESLGSTPPWLAQVVNK